MIQLKLNTEQEVNPNQARLIQKHFSSLIAWRRDGEKYYIKPLLFQGYKSTIEGMLNQLN